MCIVYGKVVFENRPSSQTVSKDDKRNMMNKIKRHLNNENMKIVKFRGSLDPKNSHFEYLAHKMCTYHPRKPSRIHLTEDILLVPETFSYKVTQKGPGKLNPKISYFP